MKFYMKIALTLVLFGAALLWVNLIPNKAAAAGEIIEYNEYTSPARSYVASRPAANYVGDPDWYASTMYVDMPSNTFKVKWNQVTHFLYVDMSNSYLPTRWESYREALGNSPKNANKDRAYHGHYPVWSQSLEIVYKDGTAETIANLGTGYGGTAFANGDLSGYANSLVTSYLKDDPMKYHPYIMYSNPSYGGYFDWNSYSIIPHSEYLQYYTDKIPVSLRLTVNFAEYYVTYDALNYKGTVHYPYGMSDVQIIPLTTNKKPNITLTSQPNQTVMNDPGFSTFNVEGYVQDVDNDTVDVIAEIPNVFYKKISIASTGSPKNFSIPIDVLSEGIPPGNYTVNVKVVDPFNFYAEASTSFSVTNRLRNKAFFLINTPIDIGTSYSDYENDSKYAERYRYDQDPSLFDNSMGMIPDSGLWRSSKYPSFPYTGAYTAIFQARDNPDADNRLDAYRLWSRDNLSSMTFMIHRKPVALFTAKLVNGSLQLTDNSYDLDHTTSPTKGLITWQWQWRKVGDQVWTEGQPPAQLPTTNPYEIRLRVRDMDGSNGIGVWSDWMKQTVGSPSNLPPVALFTVDPLNVSYRKTATVIDKSFDPDNDPLDIYSWSIVKDGWNQVWSSYGGVVAPPNVALYGVGSYQINLQVHDNRGLWSGVYSQTVQVINHPPNASFTLPNEVYRDTVITPTNLTPDPDEDGDSLQYGWYTRLNSDPYNWAGSKRTQPFTISNVMANYGITAKKAISDGWEMRLNVTDGSLTSYATQLFSVKNHIPTAAITGPSVVYQYDSHTFTSADDDEDSADRSSLQYYWRVTGSDGKITMFNTANMNQTFDEVGTYTLEHWVVDQIGDKSNIAILKVMVAENLPPSMTLTSPAGTINNPTVIDAEKEGDPLIKWTYSDPESDPQENYRLEFFTKNGLLAKTVENSDSTGGIRQYQLPNLSLERFLLYTVQGRAFSKRKWSDFSNEKAFIIDNPPEPGFTLMTDTGKNAAADPIYRTDVVHIQSTALDEDTVKGDSITHQYFLKASGGTEGLANTQGSFTKQFSSNGTFSVRQRVTDSLGLFREKIQTITVVNRIPTANITYPAGTSQADFTIVSTITPIIKWEYEDEDRDLQQRYKVRIINLTTGAVEVQSGEQATSDTQWQVPANALVENQKYAAEVEVYDGFNWSHISPRKYFMVNLLTVMGGVQHTAEWNANRQAYNLNKSGSMESPRGYSVYWAGESFVLQANATGLPDTIVVVMSGGYTAQLSPTDNSKTLWRGELYNPTFEKLPDGPVTFTFTAKNEYNTKIDTVTVTVLGDWTEYFQNHRVK
ncbi:hypothetical protein [Paenibacillus sp. sgz5001063]|uniref:hypothetical protein n=1 Tax=Paenibacillus sp. sgz5001063 TaxID=3242474 RepID=UPI0036D2426F